MKLNKIRSALITLLCLVFTMCIFTVSTLAASLPKIKKVKAAAADYSKVTVSWQKQSGAAGYQVFQYVPKTKKWKKLNNYKTNKATVSSLSPATTYTFRVRSYKKTSKGTVYSPYSDKVNVKTKLKKASKPTAKVKSTSVDLSWSKTKNAEGYQVEFYNSSKKAWVRKKTVTKNKVTIEKLGSVKSYKVRIRAYSKSDKKTVYSPYSDSVTFSTIPATVQSLKVTEVGSKTVKLSWKKVSKATGYQVYVNEYKNGKGTSYKLNKTVKTNSVSLSLSSCTNYRIRVRAYYVNSKDKKLYGEFATSSLILTLPSKVSSFKASAVTNTSVTLTWKAQKNASGYYLYSKKGSGETKKIATIPAATAKYTVKNLPELTSYKFSIKAYHKKNVSSAVYVSVKTDDSKVDSISFTKKKTSLSVGEKYTFKAEVVPSYAKNKSVSYSSSNTKIAKVSSKGVVTAVSQGTAYISAKSADGGFTVKTKVTVKNVKSTAISMPEKLEIYIGNPTELTPKFTPSNTTDKSFTVTGKDYKYKKGGILGIGAKEAVCAFSDYITIDASGRLVAKRLTIEPDSDKKFTFTVTVTAKDSGVSTSCQVSVIKRTLTVSYNQDDNPWYYGNSARLSAVVSADAGFTAKDVVWKTSNSKIATVSSDGTVKCVGVGAVTISAVSPDGKQTYDYPINCTGTVKVDKTYFESCTVGTTYKIGASYLPSGSKGAVYFRSMDPEIVTVDENGNAKMLKKGVGSIAVTTSNSYNIQRVVFTTGKCTKPATDSESLFELAKEQLDSIKQTQPALMRSDSSVFTDFVMSDKGSKLTEKDFEEIFADFAKENTRYVDSEEAEYYKNLPVASSQSQAIIGGLDIDKDIKSIKMIDSGSYYYDIKLVLENETMPDAASATMETAHGKVFDILSGTYLTEIDNALSAESMAVIYTSFAQKYHDSSVTLTINKATGLVEKVVYDMNIDISIKGLKMTVMFVPAFDSDLSFSVNNKVAVEVIR